MAILTPSSSPTMSVPPSSPSSSSSSEQAPIVTVTNVTKPKIGFSIDSIVGNNSPPTSSSSSSRSTPSPVHQQQRDSSSTPGFQSVSPRPASSEPSSPIGTSAPIPQPGNSCWPPAPPHPAYFEALANMRALYGQHQVQVPPHFAGPHPMMMAAGGGHHPPPPPGHPWWLLAQARQQQQRLFAAAAVQRFPAGKFSHFLILSYLNILLMNNYYCYLNE